MRKLVLFVLIICPFVIKAQVTDDFSDGDFTTNPVWSGEDADFTVTAQELQLNNTITDDSHLMTPSTLIDNTTWEFFFRWEGFSSTGLSSSNEVFYYLVADRNVAPETTDIAGYFVRIGNTSDEISLYRQDTDIGSVVEIIDGNANSFGGVTASTSGSIRVRVTRDEVGLWTLSADISGGTTFAEIGTTTDATYTTSSFAGIFIDYSSGNADGYFFDDISIAVPPPIQSVVVENNTTIRVTFDYDVDQTTAEDENNYSINNGITVSLAQRDVTNLDEVVLTVSNLTTNNYQLTVSNVEDDATNTPLAAPEVESFIYTQLALQTLTTNSATEIQLAFNDNLDQTSAEDESNYSIDNSIAAPMTAILDAGDNSIVTLTLANSLAPLTNYTLTYGSIDNSTQNSTVTAGTTEGFSYVIPLTIDAVTVLSETEVELEFNLDLDQTTSETTTNYSIDNSIGNPATVLQNTTDLNKVTLTLGSGLTDDSYTVTVNNVEDAANNAIAPGSTIMFSYLSLAISNISVVNNTEIEITFNQNVDQGTAETVSNYSVDGEVGTANGATLNAGDNTKVNVTFSTVFVNNTYNLTVNNVTNSSGNATASDLTDSYTFETATNFRTIVINEVFADPSPAVGLPTEEFIELYNTGSRSINIGGFVMSGGAVNNFTLAPNAYVILTDDTDVALYTSFGDVVAVPSWNGLTNSGEQITLTDNLGNLVDSLTYDTDWYNDIAKDDGGYTLEQINPELVCGGYSGNWTVSNDVQGGTPGTQNSVFDNSADVIGPDVVDISALDNNTVQLSFNEPMDEASLNAGVYAIDNGLTQTAVSPNLGLFSVNVDLDGSLVSGTTYSVTITGVTDCSGNAIASNFISLEYDIDPPTIDRVVINSLNQIEVLFNEALNESTAETENNFSVDNSIGNPSSAILDNDDNQRVRLTFGSEFTPELQNTLSVQNLEDLSNNAISGTLDQTFTYTQDIDTVMVQGVNLIDIRFDSSLEEIAAETLTNYFVSGGAGNPVLATLDNADDVLVHLVFGEDLDENSNLTLATENLKNTTDEFLFTPEYVFIFDTDAPEIVQITVQDATNILLGFNEILEQTSAELVNNYNYNDTFPTSAVLQSDQKSVLLTFSDNFQRETEFTLNVTGLRDLYGNTIVGTTQETFVYDIFPPEIDSLIVVSANSLRLIFNEHVEEISAETITNYVLDNGIGSPTTATRNDQNNNEVLLEFAGIIPSIDGLVLDINNLSDFSDNSISTTVQSTFDYGKISIGEIIALSTSSLKIIFNKAPNGTLASDINNYTINSNSPTLVEVDGSDDKTYTLTLSTALSDNSSNTLSLQNITDGSGNTLQQNDFTFDINSQFNQFELISSNTIEIDFNINLDVTSTTLTSNYNLSPASEAPVVATLSADKVRLIFATDFTANVNYTLSWSNILNEFNTRLPDFSIDFEVDNTAPSVTAVDAFFDMQLSLKFNELLKESSAENEDLYFVDNGIGVPTKATYNASDSTVLLVFSNAFSESTNYSINVDRVTDVLGNAINNQMIAFTFTAPLQPSFGELLITEIMADPTPSLGLPQIEYVEIYNNSTNTFNLAVVNFSDETNTVNLGNVDLTPGQYLIITSDADAFSTFGNVLEISFPSLTNSGETISLTNTNGDLVDKIAFESAWYRDTSKDAGGYSLERIFFAEQCIQELNWIASTNSNGGTPGTQNAVFNTQFDTTSPEVTSVNIIGANGIIIHFNEVLDSVSLEGGTYTFTDGLTVQEITASNSGVDSVQITFSTDLVVGTLYNVVVSNVSDCAGNVISTNSLDFGIGKTPEYGDLLFTEIMPDPSPAIRLPEEEFIEIYNNSTSIINLEGIRLADASDTTTLSDYVLQSGQYVVLSSTSNVNDFISFGSTLGVTSFPSLGNTVDSLYLFLSDNTLIDALFYTSNFYWDSEKDDGGYSLERVFFAEQCIQELNWIASTNSNGGTPGVQNAVLNTQFDTTSPEVTSVNINGASGIIIHFNEVLDSISLESGTYTFSNGLTVQEITASNSGVDSVQVTFSADLVVGTLYNVAVSNVSDCAGNVINTNSQDFGIGKTPEYGDLLFTEIMPDPSPAIGLPEEEFIELYNNSTSIINLEGIQLADASDTTVLSNYVLKSGDYLILSSTTNVENFTSFGNNLGVTSFPSLGNTVDSLYLFLNDNTLIEKLFYTSSFYRDEDKKDGGFSLERIFIEEQCIQKLNWIASTNSNGGTPGTQNAVFNTQFDSTSPEVTAVNINGANGIIIRFNEVLDSVSLEGGTYTFTNGLTVQEIVASNSGADSVQITFSTDLIVGTLYNVAVSNVSDCAGNTISTNSQDFGIGKTPEYGDLLFTEIMPDPSPAIDLPEEEFIEIYNNSGSIINLEGIQLADASDTTILSNHVLKSSDYLILSSNGNVEDFSLFGNTLGVTSIPSLGNSADSLYLFLDDNTRIDQLFYTSQFYRDEDKKDGGYSLERIFFVEQCLQALNWIASSATTGGTPGSENSVLNGIIDTEVPVATSLDIIDNQSISLLFNEPMDSLSLVEGNYDITRGLVIAELEGIEKGGREVILVFTTPLVNGTVYNINISNITDCAGNTLASTNFEFGFGEKPGFNELIITEIMADPDADAGSEVSLPSVEYLELYNPTDKNIELSGLTLQDGTSQTQLSPLILFAKQYLLLVPRGDEGFYPDIPVLPVSSWPTLNNGGETIALFNESELVFSLGYDSDWYKDSDKTGGGYSLEMIDVTNPCGDINNWTATIDARGGTPGEVNSVAASNPDSFGPKLLGAIANNSTKVTFTFDEKLTPESIKNGTITIDPSIIITAFENDTLEISAVSAILASELSTNQVYAISVNAFTDCVGNVVNNEGNTASFILPEVSDSLDIILNEILFNPRNNGVDFVEIYNNSEKAINIKGWQTSSINEDNELLPKTITTSDLVIDPATYKVITIDAANIKENYLGADESTFIEVSSLSSMPNDEGTVILLDSLGNQIDRFDYSDDFHFNLLDDVNGVSLERINFNVATNNENSWKSAASTAGFATPGLPNSQFKTETQTSGALTIDPKVFIPDNTGANNFTTINYDLDNAGSFANIIIYDHRGKLVKTIAQGELLSTSGFFTWDGTNDSGEKASFGYYVIYFEIFNASGNTDVMKETIVLGTRF